MPRRKKKWMLLRGHAGAFIVVERRWYDYTGIARQRGDRKRWWIVAESDDYTMLKNMAVLSGKSTEIRVNYTE